MKLNDIDKAILNRIQSDFPIDSNPFGAIADELGYSEEQILEHTLRLRQSGIIRRIGANFVPHKLGFVSTLCAAKVPEDQIDAFAKTVNRFEGVTHNYQRENEFNIWFTFIGKSMKEIEAALNKIKNETGIKTILNLPATKVFKIKAEFKV
ncbi:MAG: Lrp/AsnC family transcriptional regulator [Desulfobacteraceae bacterium]|nr:Lrp/AsnC family transcriptional regulator [Desulfobacteraceae bacterium]